MRSSELVARPHFSEIDYDVVMARAPKQEIVIWGALWVANLRRERLEAFYIAAAGMFDSLLQSTVA
jgi:hypothetical protein